MHIWVVNGSCCLLSSLLLPFALPAQENSKQPKQSPLLLLEAISYLDQYTNGRSKGGLSSASLTEEVKREKQSVEKKNHCTGPRVPSASQMKSREDSFFGEFGSFLAMETKFPLSFFFPLPNVYWHFSQEKVWPSPYGHPKWLSLEITAAVLSFHWVSSATFVPEPILWNGFIGSKPSAPGYKLPSNMPNIFQLFLFSCPKSFIYVASTIWVTYSCSFLLLGGLFWKKPEWRPFLMWEQVFKKRRLFFHIYNKMLSTPCHQGKLFIENCQKTESGYHPLAFP